MRNSEKAKHSQSGMAILMVLGIVSATMLLTVHLMSFSETIAKESAVNAMTSRLRYSVESALDEAFWMHLTDRRLFSNRNLGGGIEARESVSDFGPWMLDGSSHELEDGCIVVLKDAIKSFSIDYIEAVKEGIDEDDSDGIEAADTFIDVYKDYCDNDDFVNLYGMEVEDYEAEGFPTLPRNGAMRLRAEIYWLANWRNVIKGDITIIPPEGLSLSTNGNTSSRRSRRTSRENNRTTRRKPNFFTATEGDVRNILERQAADLSDAQIEEILRARTECQTTSVPLTDVLDGDLLMTVRSLFSFEESGFAEMTAVASAYDGSLTVRRTVTRQVDISNQAIFSDNAKNTFSIWEVKSY